MTVCFTLEGSEPSGQTANDGSKEVSSKRVHCLEDVKLDNGSKNNENRVDLEEGVAHGKFKAESAEEVGVLLALDFGVWSVALLEFAEEESAVRLSKHVGDAAHNAEKDDDVLNGEFDVVDVNGGEGGEDGEGASEDVELVGGDGDVVGRNAFHEELVVRGGTTVLLGRSGALDGRTGFSGGSSSGHFFFFLISNMFFFTILLFCGRH